MENNELWEAYDNITEYINKTAPSMDDLITAVVDAGGQTKYNMIIKANDEVKYYAEKLYDLAKLFLVSDSLTTLSKIDLIQDGRGGSVKEISNLYEVMKDVQKDFRVMLESKKKSSVSAEVGKKKDRPSSYTTAKYTSLLKKLEQYSGSDTVDNGNYTILDMTNAELQIVRHSLGQAIAASELKEWSKWTIDLLENISAVLTKFLECVPKPLLKSWNAALSGIQKSLEEFKAKVDGDGD